MHECNSQKRPRDVLDVKQPLFTSEAEYSCIQLTLLSINSAKVSGHVFQHDVFALKDDNLTIFYKLSQETGNYYVS